MNDLPLNSARALHDVSRLQQRAQSAIDEIEMQKRKHYELQEASANANIESYKLLKQQLEEQTEINQRLEHEFKMGAREAVITRRIAYWSLVVGTVGVVIAILSYFRG